ncbi:hypothetical protein J2T17_002413 [Paenibacillus mucilaginosus]|uniref:family 43 glycosylhydrolase n=1 Tax=Paenibacillus mucilaginosus TaxID=61624 RepID=UPI003D1AFDD3
MRKTRVFLAVFMASAILLGVLGYQAEVKAANPYLPLWEHIPDGEPRIFEDPDNPGKYRVYIYGSHDTKQIAYCGYDITVWSAPVEDLNNWRNDGIAFQSIVNGAPDTLFAPDVVEVKESDGTKTYYLYPNNQASGRKSMVAKSKRPDGPYEVSNWKAGSNKTETEGIMGFDPAVFVDDDGRVYGYWGFQQSNAAELDPTTMATLKSGATIINGMVGNSNDMPAGNEFRFFEASSLRKVKGKYVFIYSRKTNVGEYGLGASNNTLAYAYGDTPLGPWTYGGTIVDARGPVIGENGLMTGSQSGVNTHGSILEINGQWYVFYHRSINNDGYSRQSMVSPINVDVTADGKVVITGTKTVKDSKGNEYTGVEVTSEGFELNGLNPYKYYSAGITSFIRNNSYVKAAYDTWNDDAPVVNNKNNSIVGYKYFNFDGNPVNGQSTQLELYLTPKGVDATIDIMLDNPWTAQGGKKIGSLSISKDAVQQKTKMIVPLPDLDVTDGKHGIYFVFKSASSNVISDLNGLKFSFAQVPALNEIFNSNLNRWNINAGSPVVDHGLILTNASSITSKVGADWKHYEFASHMNLIQGTVGLRFLQSDEKNYYELQLNDGNLILSSVLYGKKTTLTTTSHAFKPNEYASVSIAKVNNLITIRINGIVVLQQQNSDHDTGTIGVTSYDGSSAIISSVLVQKSEEEEIVPATFSVSVDGVPVPDFAVSAYDYNVLEYSYIVPAGTTTVPTITAASSDTDVKVSISQPDTPLGTAVVRFNKGDKVKTYKVHFSSNETVSFASGLPQDWQVLNPTNTDNPLGAITTSGNTVSIQTYKNDSDYPNDHDVIQLPYSTAQNWTFTVRIQTDKPINDASITRYSQVGLAIRTTSTGEYFKLNAMNSGTNINVNSAARSGSTRYGNTSSTTLNTQQYYWLRLVKTGFALQAYYSTNNGGSWTSFDSPVSYVPEFFQGAKLQLYGVNRSPSTDLKATYTVNLMMSDGESQEAASAQQAVEQGANLFGTGIAVPNADSDSPLTKVTKAQQFLAGNQALNQLGVTGNVYYQEDRFALSLAKGAASMTIKPFIIVTSREWPDFEQLVKQAKALSPNVYTAASWNKLQNALADAEQLNQQSDAVSIALVYYKVKAALDAMEQTKAKGVPGAPVLSSNNGYDTGLQGGSYTITMNMWYGNNGSTYKLYENGVLIDSQWLTDRSPSAQTAQTEVSGKVNGTYVYTCELINSYGTTSCSPITVKVTDASPGAIVLSNDNWDGNGDYKVTMNMWWGTNAGVYMLYENGVLIDTQTLPVNTPNAQTAVTSITGRTRGTYEYRAELKNDAGLTESKIMKVTVQ